jgi:membrane associated rhomboid family serine protease
VLIPLGDVIPSRIRPWGTWTLLALMATGLVASPDWVTLIANLLAAWIFGETVENRMGHVRYLLFAAGGAVMGTLAPQWLGWPPLASPMSASAAAGAIVAAYLVLHPGSRVLVLAWLVTAVDVIEVPSFFFAGLWVIAQCFHALGPFMDITAALLTCASGIAWGLATVWVLRRPVDWGYTPQKNVPKA